MKAKNFLEAIEILTKNHSNEIVINKSSNNGSVTGTVICPTLDIINCTAAAVNNLINEGFTLSMKSGFMSVEDYTK